MKTKQNKKIRRKQMSKGLLNDLADQVLPNYAYYLSKINFLQEEKDLDYRIFLFNKDIFEIIHKCVLLKGAFKHDLNGEIATFNYMLNYLKEAIGIDQDILFKMDYDEVPDEICEVANYTISKSICYLSIVIITNLLSNEKYKQNNKIFSDYIQKQERRMKLERLGELAA